MFNSVTGMTAAVGRWNRKGRSDSKRNIRDRKLYARKKIAQEEVKISREKFFPRPSKQRRRKTDWSNFKK
jgi:hypothetical protein